MKKVKFVVAPLLAVTMALGVIGFHPGRAVSEPRLAQLTPAQIAGVYTLDQAHSGIGFDIGHYGLSRVHGRFNKFEGTVNVDPNNLDKSSVEVTIDVASVDTAIAPRDVHLRRDDFFDVEKFPTITFKSTKVRKTNRGYTAEGNLTLRGITRKVAIPFRTYGPITDTQEAVRGGIVADPIVIKRLDFGLGNDAKLPNGNWHLSNDINIRISLEATRNVEG